MMEVFYLFPDLPSFHTLIAEPNLILNPHYNLTVTLTLTLTLFASSTSPYRSTAFYLRSLQETAALCRV